MRSSLCIGDGARGLDGFGEEGWRGCRKTFNKKYRCSTSRRRRILFLISIKALNKREQVLLCFNMVAAQSKFFLYLHTIFV